MIKLKTGVFDSGSNKKYNDAISNYDKEDGIDIVKCSNECLNCKYRDITLDRCLFETCIKKLYPVCGQKIKPRKCHFQFHLSR